MSEDRKKIDKSEKELSPKKKHQLQIKKLEEKISNLESEVGEWKNKFMRALADMDNAKKQNAKDQQYYLKYRAVPVIEKLLPSLDIFGAVLRAEVEDPVLKNYLVGFQYVYANLLEALKSEGLTEIEVKVGDAFDENKMHALEAIYDETLAPNTVVEVRNNAFMFIDRLIRPAQVNVSTNIKTDEEGNPLDPSTLN